MFRWELCGIVAQNWDRSRVKSADILRPATPQQPSVSVAIPLPCSISISISLSSSLYSLPRGSTCLRIVADYFRSSGIAVRRTDPLLLSLGVRTVLPEITDVISRSESELDFTRASSVRELRARSRLRSGSERVGTSTCWVSADKGTTQFTSKCVFKDGSHGPRRLVSVPRCSLHARVACGRASLSSSRLPFLPYPPPPSFYITLSSYLFFLRQQRSDTIRIFAY